MQLFVYIGCQSCIQKNCRRSGVLRHNGRLWPLDPKVVCNAFTIVFTTKFGWVVYGSIGKRSRLSWIICQKHFHLRIADVNPTNHDAISASPSELLVIRIFTRNHAQKHRKAREKLVVFTFKYQESRGISNSKKTCTLQTAMITLARDSYFCR